MIGYKKAAVAVAVAALLGAGATVATADPINVNAGPDSLTGVAAFDWAPSNVIAYNGNQAIADFLNSNSPGGGGCTSTTTGCVFDAFLHGTLSAFQDSATNTINSTVGTNYQVSFEMGFSEKVIAARSGVVNDANFGFGPSGKTSGPFSGTDLTLSNGADNFFRMYLNVGAPVANPLLGTGFGAGTLLFSGQVAPVGGFGSDFAVTGSGALGGANTTTPATWTGAGVTSVHGNGSSSDLNLAVSGTTTVAGEAFFGGYDITSFLLSNISQNLAFTTVDPSILFPEGAVVSGGTGINALTGVGTINGGLTFVAGTGFVASGPSIIFQTDPNSPISGIPEPATLALISLGLLGVGAARGRRKE